jgi:hypothetical protein
VEGQPAFRATFWKESAMKSLSRCPAAVRLGLVAIMPLLLAERAGTQDPELKPTYGQVKLKAGFEPDPYEKKVEAGGEINTKLGGVAAWVAKAPDFKLFYTAGKYPLTFTVESKADTTLLINLPDGKWVANDDGPEGLNPLLRFAKPQSGRYDIWVGTFEKGGTPPAKLIITELK